MLAPIASASGSMLSAEPRTGSPAANTAIRTDPPSPVSADLMISVASLLPMSAGQAVTRLQAAASSSRSAWPRATARTGSPRPVSRRTTAPPIAPVAPRITRSFLPTRLRGALEAPPSLVARSSLLGPGGARAPLARGVRGHGLAAFWLAGFAVMGWRPFGSRGIAGHGLAPLRLAGAPVMGWRPFGSRSSPVMRWRPFGWLGPWSWGGGPLARGAPVMGWRPFGSRSSPVMGWRLFGWRGLRSWAGGPLGRGVCGHGLALLVAAARRAATSSERATSAGTPPMPQPSGGNCVM